MSCEVPLSTVRNPVKIASRAPEVLTIVIARPSIDDFRERSWSSCELIAGAESEPATSLSATGAGVGGAPAGTRSVINYASSTPRRHRCLDLDCVEQLHARTIE